MRTATTRKAGANRRIRAALCAIVLAVLPAGAAPAGSEPVLREQIKVFGKLVTLGDLFENAGEAASRPVFRSPDLGETGVVNAGRVAEAASQHGLRWSNPGGISKVEVSRPGRLVPLENVRKAIAGHIAGEDEVWTVSFSRGTRAYHIDPRIEGPISVKHVDLNSRTGAFRAVITVEGSSPRAEDKTFSGQAYPSVEAIVPARTIERGATIVEQDLEVVRLPRSQVGASAIEAMEDAVGMAATKQLQPGRAVLRSDYELPMMVKRNAVVTIVYRTPGLVLKTRGRAMADGAEGQVVPIMNLQSKRTVEAEVTGTGTVSVSQPGAGQPRQTDRTARKAAGGTGGRTSHVIR